MAHVILKKVNLLKIGANYTFCLFNKLKDTCSWEDDSEDSLYAWERSQAQHTTGPSVDHVKLFMKLK